MGVRGAVARAAAGRAHVLLVEVPGRPRLRVEAERVLARRGWVVADSPADADVLLVCGPVEGRLAEAVERTWDGLPGPRARVDLPDGTGEAGLAEALEDARARLLDLRHQDEDAAGRAPAPPEDVAADAGDMAPDGVPLAGNDDADRDGLEMDVLHLPLGPVLRHWPAGLVLGPRCTATWSPGPSARLLDSGAGAPGAHGPPHRRGRATARPRCSTSPAGPTAPRAPERCADDVLDGPETDPRRRSPTSGAASRHPAAPVAAARGGRRARRPGPREGVPDHLAGDASTGSSPSWTGRGPAWDRAPAQPPAAPACPRPSSGSWSRAGTSPSPGSSRPWHPPRPVGGRPGAGGPVPDPAHAGGERLGRTRDPAPRCPRRGRSWCSTGCSAPAPRGRRPALPPGPSRRCGRPPGCCASAAGPPLLGPPVVADRAAAACPRPCSWSRSCPSGTGRSPTSPWASSGSTRSTSLSGRWCGSPAGEPNSMHSLVGGYRFLALALATSCR